MPLRRATRTRRRTATARHRRAGRVVRVGAGMAGRGDWRVVRAAGGTGAGQLWCADRRGAGLRVGRAARDRLGRGRADRLGRRRDPAVGWFRAGAGRGRRLPGRTAAVAGRCAGAVVALLWRGRRAGGGNRPLGPRPDAPDAGPRRAGRHVAGSHARAGAAVADDGAAGAAVAGAAGDDHRSSGAAARTRRTGRVRFSPFCLLRAAGGGRLYPQPGPDRRAAPARRCDGVASAAAAHLGGRSWTGSAARRARWPRP